MMAILLLCFSCLHNQKVFVSKQQHDDHLNSLRKLNRQMRKQLAQYGTDGNSALNLNIYFDTDDSLKAQHLADTLEKIGYRANIIHRSPKDKTLWVLTPTSGRVSMDSIALDNWSNSVCNLAYRHDCEFEGWSPVTE